MMRRQGLGAGGLCGTLVLLGAVRAAAAAGNCTVPLSLLQTATARGQRDAEHAELLEALSIEELVDSDDAADPEDEGSARLSDDGHAHGAPGDGLAPVWDGIQFEPEVWNADAEVRASHNCFMYALNDLHEDVRRECAAERRLHDRRGRKFHRACRKFFHKPGYYFQNNVQKRPKTDPWGIKLAKCNFMEPELFSDNPTSLIWVNEATGQRLAEEDPCPGGHYMAALVIDPGKGFHFYRRDHACQAPENRGQQCWSHKPGILRATDRDASGREIRSLRAADRRYGKRDYSDICGVFCVPFNSKGATHSDNRHAASRLG